MKTVQLELSKADAVAAATVRFAPADASVECRVNYGDVPRAAVLSEKLDRQFGVRTVAPVVSLGYLTLQFDVRGRLCMLDIFTNPETWTTAPLPDVAAEAAEVRLGGDMDANGHGASGSDPLRQIHDSSRGVLALAWLAPTYWVRVADHLVLGLAGPQQALPRSAQLAELRIGNVHRR